jgi:hypothetical protein
MKKEPKRQPKRQGLFEVKTKSNKHGYEMEIKTPSTEYFTK